MKTAEEKIPKSGAKGRKRVAAVFGVTEVQRLTGVNRITLHSWDHSGFLSPSVSGGGRGTGNRRKYSFNDLVAIRVIHRLRGEGVTLKALRKIAKYMRQIEKVQNPFAERYLAMAGRDVVMVRGEESISLLKNPGQYSLFLRLDLAGEAEILRSMLAKRAA